MVAVVPGAENTNGGMLVAAVEAPPRPKEGNGVTVANEGGPAPNTGGAADDGGANEKPPVGAAGTVDDEDPNEKPPVERADDADDGVGFVVVAGVDPKPNVGCEFDKLN